MKIELIVALLAGVVSSRQYWNHKAIAEAQLIAQQQQM
jgi:hypothetical protein